MQVINLTPHDIKYQNKDGNVTVFEKSGNIARVSTVDAKASTVDAPFKAQTLPGMGDVCGLPTTKPDTIYIVSGFVLSALKSAGCKRADVFSPGTGPKDGPVRNDKGHIVAVVVFNSLV